VTHRGGGGGAGGEREGGELMGEMGYFCKPLAFQKLCHLHLSITPTPLLQLPQPHPSDSRTALSGHMAAITV